MKRTTAQEIGELAESTALHIATKNRDWIARKADKDFGVDIEMELVDSKMVTGQYVKIQVKGITNYQIIDYQIKYRIKNNFLRYCEECRVPIILVLIDTNNEIGYFIWVQEYLRMYKTDIHKYKTSNILIPSTNDFESGLTNKIKNIASGCSHTQLQLDLKASLASAFLLGDTEVYEKLTELSIDIAKTNSLEINKLIDDLIILGNKAWGTYEGNKKSNILYNFCRKFGNNFSIGHIKKMVLRGTSYSRVGIISLGILYDEYPDYIKSMNLPSVFGDHEDIRVNYYCLFRERYLGQKSINLWRNNDIDYEIGELTVRNADKTDLYLKWPNRGDSTILDFLTLKENCNIELNNV